MNKVYTRINWEDYPSTKTEIDQTNLNKMDSSLDTLDNRIVSLDTTKTDQTTSLQLIKSVEYEEDTGKFVFTKLNGTTIEIDTNLEKLALNFDYDATTEQLIITLDDGTKTYVDMSSLITEYDFQNTGTIMFSVSEDGIVTANIVKGSITEEYLQPNYLANIKEQANIATQQAQESENYSITSKSWAIGGTSTREGEDSNNSKYWAEQAKNSSGMAIATTEIAGKVLATNDVKVAPETGAMSIGTEFTVPEGLTNLVSGSAWNVILGQLAKMVEEYINSILNGLETRGDVIAKSIDNPISMIQMNNTLMNHNHNTIYYTKNEIDSKLTPLQVISHTLTKYQTEVNYLQGSAKSYAGYCTFSVDFAVPSGTNLQSDNRIYVSGLPKPDASSPSFPIFTGVLRNSSSGATKVAYIGVNSSGLYISEINGTIGTSYNEVRVSGVYKVSSN